LASLDATEDGCDAVYRNSCVNIVHLVKGREWQITGFRVHNKGRGFDHGFLGVLGASTKDAEAKSRGGLGEGLKMCITNLLREGAHV
jgi:hypothetical protein